MGVYLGACMGLGFWSKLDPAGQTEAPTFESIDHINEMIEEWECLGTLPSDMTFPQVNVAGKEPYIDEKECVRVGAEPWSNFEINQNKEQQI